MTKGELIIKRYNYTRELERYAKERAEQDANIGANTKKLPGSAPSGETYRFVYSVPQD
jgi:hypothetical protein